MGRPTPNDPSGDFRTCAKPRAAHTRSKPTGMLECLGHRGSCGGLPPGALLHIYWQMNNDLAPFQSKATLSPAVTVCVTRSGVTDMEILVFSNGHEYELPWLDLKCGEHPAEGAWRVLKTWLGDESYWAFRRYGDVQTQHGKLHVLQTSPGAQEITDGSPGPRVDTIWRWLPLSTAKAGFTEPWRTAAQYISSQG